MKTGKKKTLGFALGSGGSRGMAHIGFLKAMEEEGIRADYVAGCSMGAVVGAAYASGVSPEVMYQATKKLRFFDLFSFSNCRSGLMGTKKVRALLVKYIGDKEFSDLDIPFGCTATDMISQSLIEIDEGSVADAVVASSSIPAVFKATTRDGMRLVDGGVLERVPVNFVKRMGADVVVAVDVLGYRRCRDENRMPYAMGILLDTIDIMDNQRQPHVKKDLAGKVDLWLEPELGTMSQYMFRELDFAYRQGYEMGKENAQAIKDLLAD